MRERPRFLALWQIRFPIGAIASIGHRVSGVLLLVALPPLTLALDQSLRGRSGFEQLLDELRSPQLAPLVFVAVWALTHHLLAGIRHLAMDIGIGFRLRQARATAWISIVAALLAAAVTALRWLT